MGRKFNEYGKPLPNKKDLKLLPFVDTVVKRRLNDYIFTELEDSYDNIELSSYLSQFDFDELTEMIVDDIGEYKVRDKNNNSLYYIFLKNTMEWFFKNMDYKSSKIEYEDGGWKRGWMPDIDNLLGGGFEEAYALTLLWVNNELKKFGTSVPEIEQSITESNIKSLIKKILKEQIVESEHDICGILTCDKLNEVLNKIDYSKLNHREIIKLKTIVSKYKRDVNNNLKDVPKNGGLRGATGDSEKDICDVYLHQIQSLICEPKQE